MGLLISCDESSPIPHCPLTLELTCDGDHPAPVRERFVADNFVVCYADAMRAGWLERRGDRRLFLCPGCSRKR
jgi:hypothetical protein